MDLAIQTLVYDILAPRIIDKYLLRLELYPDLSCDSGDLVLLGKVDSDHIICLVNDKKILKPSSINNYSLKTC